MQAKWLWLAVGIVMLGMLASSTLAPPPATAALLPSGTPRPRQSPTPEVWVEQSRTLYTLNRPQAALYLLDQIIALEGTETDTIALFRAYLLHGQILAALGNPAQAIIDYTRAINLQPDIAEVYAYRGALYQAQADYDDALQDFSQAIEYDGSEASYYVARAQVYLAVEAYGSAAADYAEALLLEPNNAAYYRERGYVWLAAGEVSAAVGDFNTYRELVPNAPDQGEIEAAISAASPD